MKSRSRPSVQDPGLSAALNRFPQCEFALRKLLMASEDFRDLCHDLAEAERALANVSISGLEELREARKAEWQELIQRLVAEIGIVLAASEAWKHRSGR